IVELGPTLSPQEAVVHASAVLDISTMALPADSVGSCSSWTGSHPGRAATRAFVTRPGGQRARR
ncbi:MAG: hypothetical protein Q7V62_05875, partial [Actinomycetota bacterium]|nr:hypothetical protein [Actinomycetota bacterium]